MEEFFDLRPVLQNLQGVQSTDQRIVKLSTVGGVRRGPVSTDNRPRASPPLGKPLDEIRAADVLIVIEGIGFKINRFMKDGFEGRFHIRLLMVVLSA